MRQKGVCRTSVDLSRCSKGSQVPESVDRMIEHQWQAWLAGSMAHFLAMPAQSPANGMPPGCNTLLCGRRGPAKSGIWRAVSATQRLPPLKCSCSVDASRSEVSASIPRASKSALRSSVSSKVASGTNFTCAYIIVQPRYSMG